MSTPVFAPQLYIPNRTFDISFYINGLGATEVRKWMNDDGSYHVSELSIDGALFHLHEENTSKQQYDPVQTKGITTMIGLFVDNVDAVMNRAINAGAKEIVPAQDYDYGYRQGEFKDPFGHLWMIEKKI